MIRKKHVTVSTVKTKRSFVTGHSVQSLQYFKDYLKHPAESLDSAKHTG